MKFKRIYGYIDIDPSRYGTEIAKDRPGLIAHQAVISSPKHFEKLKKEIVDSNPDLFSIYFHAQHTGPKTIYQGVNPIYYTFFKSMDDFNRFYEVCKLYGVHDK